MPHDVPRYDNPGHPPTRWPADTRIGVKWANGRTSPHTFTVNQLVWKRRGLDFDVDQFWRV